MISFIHFNYYLPNAYCVSGAILYSSEPVPVELTF